MKILTVIGARPQFIKASVVSMALVKKGMEEIIVHTGQHYDENMSEIFFSQMQIPRPAHNLQLGHLSHGSMTGRMIEKIESLILDLQPDYVLVYGDTNSTLAAAIATSKTDAKLIHIEAGLRSFNMRMPEEINRIVTDRLSDVLFCPTLTAIKNLQEEGFEKFMTKSGKKVKIELIGDVMKDSAEYFSKFAASNCSKAIFSLLDSEFALCTLHRAENVKHKGRLEAIFSALNSISQDVQIILPLHPGTKNALENFGIVIQKSVKIIDPVGFFDMLMLLQNCKAVLTDSGGLQKEAFFFKKPCITLRDETEWIELVENGYNFLAGADQRLIEKSFQRLDAVDFSEVKPLYGEGCVSDKIAESIIADFQTN